MSRLRIWLRPELAIGAAGIVILGLLVVQLVLIQSTFQLAIPLESTEEPIWAQLLRDRDLLVGYSWLMILLVIAIFLGLAFLLIGKWRQGEQMNLELERKVQERTAELAYERKLYHSLIEAMPFPVFRKDREGHITFGNSRLWPALGYTEAEAMGKTDYDLAPTELADRYRADDLRVMETGETIEVVAEHVPHNGTPQVIRIVKTPVRDESNAVTGVQVMFWDITGGRRQSEKLRESERMLAKAQQMAHVGSWRWDLPSEQLEWSEEMYRIFGVEPANFQGPIPELIARAVHPDDRAKLDRAELLARRGKPLPVEFRVRRPDGAERIVWAEGELVTDTSGEPTGMVGVVQDITERKHAEDLLRQQNAYLDALHETTVNLIGRLQLNDLLEGITQRAGTLMGTPHGYIYLHEPHASEMKMSVGQGIFEQMAGTPAHLGAGVTGLVWESGQVLVVDDYQAWDGRLTKPGHEKLCAVIGIPLKSAEQVVGVFGLAYTDRAHHFGAPQVEILTRFAHLASIALDNVQLYAAAQQEIAERQRAADELRANRAQLESVMNNTEDLILSIDRDLRLTFFNEPFREMTERNLKLDVHPGMPVFDVVAPDTRALHAAYYERGFAGSQCRYEVDYTRSNGSKAFFETYLNPIYGDQRHVTGLAIFTRNITERKLAEQELTRQKELLQTVFDRIPVMIGVFNPQGRYSIVNREWERTLGYDLEQMNEGDTLREMYPDDEPRGAMFNFMFAPTRGWRDFRTVVRGGQVIDTSWAFTSLSDGATIAFGQDITQRKQVDHLKNEFISTVSHELRTPLTSIRGSLGLISSGVAGAIPERVQQMVDIAYKNSERLVRLINDILDIERIESGKLVFQFKPLDVVPLLEQAIEANRAYGEQYQVSFVLLAGERDLKVYGDADRIMQVMTNLLSNAAKFSPPHSQVELSAQRVGTAVQIAVCDHGSGIPEAFRDRIYQKFAQAEASDTRRRAGTGLGLSIVHAIVERHGGTIDYDSRPDEGTTFYVQLPEYRETPALPLGPSQGGPRVLILEDDRDVALLLSVMLRAAGFESDMAYDAAQALDRLGSRHYDALTLDLLLPDRDGISLIRELRKREDTRDLPIVVVSARAEQERQQLNGDAMWVADWLQKPIDPQALAHAVSHAARRAQAGPSNILHVEDEPDIIGIVQEIFRDRATLTPARTLQEARSLLEQQAFDLMLLDLTLPDGSGTELLPLLRRQNANIPVVIFSVREDDEHTLRQVSATLIKSRTTNEELLQTITQLLPVRGDTVG